MNRAMFKTGLAERKAVLGAEYVEKSMKSANEFNKPFQEFVTEYCWGVGWGDKSLTRRERSILNLGMIACLGRFQEFELHFRGAIRNGLNKDELRSLLTQITIYCGVPVGVECFRVARKVLDEMPSKPAKKAARKPAKKKG